MSALPLRALGRPCAVSKFLDGSACGFARGSTHGFARRRDVVMASKANSDALFAVYAAVLPLSLSVTPDWIGLPAEALFATALGGLFAYIASSDDGTVGDTLRLIGAAIVTVVEEAQDRLAADGAGTADTTFGAPNSNSVTAQKSNRVEFEAAPPPTLIDTVEDAKERATKQAERERVKKRQKRIEVTYAEMQRQAAANQATDGQTVDSSPELQMDLVRDLAEVGSLEALRCVWRGEVRKVRVHTARLSCSGE